MNKEFDCLKHADKVVLAYSGGLDTSVMVAWLKEKGVQEVICVSGDLGQIEDPQALEAKALASGASKFYNVDLKEAFLKDFAFPALQAGAKYENAYLLGTALARPAIAKALVEVAKKEDCQVIVHGCTGKGNDQIRFELSIMALAPEIKVIAPWRFWELKGRSEEIAYAKAHGIHVTDSNEASYSEDENLWHISHEGLDLEKASQPAQLEKVLKWVTPPELCEDEAEYVKLTFEQGLPVAVDGKTMDPVTLVQCLNTIGGRNGIGIDDIVESRLAGMKSRGLYENPAASLLHFAHEKLESMTIHPDLLKYKQKLAHDYADLAYNGKLLTPMKKALDAFIAISQENVTGTVTLKLYKGSILPYGIEADQSLYQEDYASFEADEVYDQGDATGFINLYGLATKIYAQVRKVG
ncbi:argininosuccinate synthase [Atopobacter sp. AH10]|uniref:argininosuccinate synthase n=1 Tax=Atopobacter sp. AH10 TaxID=2315861 RepID=UPI000EF27F00|nr:argininosuccinate synthase [Atopobacter sp. AH10]RLK62672.1 argininosuccinate synthase [Atopobacter sp. AH10]